MFIIVNNDSNWLCYDALVMLQSYFEEGDMILNIEDLGNVMFEELAFENLFITPSYSEILTHILTLEAEMNYQIYAMSNNGVELS